MTTPVPGQKWRDRKHHGDVVTILREDPDQLDLRGWWTLLDEFGDEISVTTGTLLEFYEPVPFATAKVVGGAMAVVIAGSGTNEEIAKEVVAAINAANSGWAAEAKGSEIHLTACHQHHGNAVALEEKP